MNHDRDTRIIPRRDPRSTRQRRRRAFRRRGQRFHRHNRRRRIHRKRDRGAQADVAGFVALRCLRGVGAVAQVRRGVRPRRTARRDTFRGGDGAPHRRALIDRDRDRGLVPASTPAPPLNVGVGSFVGETSALIDTSGGVVSTVNVTAPLLPTLPASSDCSACAVYVPSARCADLYDQLEPLTTALPETTVFPATEEPS